MLVINIFSSFFLYVKYWTLRSRLNWWKGKPSGSIACTRKQQPRFLLKLFISSNEWCHITDAPQRMSETPFSNVNNIHVCTLHDPWGCLSWPPKLTRVRKQPFACGLKLLVLVNTGTLVKLKNLRKNYDLNQCYTLRYFK